MLDSYVIPWDKMKNITCGLEYAVAHEHEQNIQMIKILKDTLSFDNAANIHVAIRYQLRYAYVWKHLFHSEPW